MKFETERLVLRPAKKSDWRDLVEGVSKDVAKDMAGMPWPFKKKQALEWINRNIRKWKKKEKEGYSWVIELKSERKVIGVSGIFDINSANKFAESGSWVSKNYWRQGYILEAKIKILDFAFGKLNLRRLITVTFKDNKASNAMSRKLGYKLEGTLRKHEKSFVDNKFRDEFIYGLLKVEWKKIRPKLIKDLNRKLKSGGF